jgi:hypothetical protein
MNIIEIQTLIDITETHVIRPKQGSTRELDQQRNFNTLKQCIEIRSIISYDTSPLSESKDIKDLGFGSKYKGKHKIWTFRFVPDRSGVYSDNVNEVGCLIDDLHEIPIIKNLTETINIDRAVFDLKDISYRNTLIKSLSKNF